MDNKEIEKILNNLPIKEQILITKGFLRWDNMEVFKKFRYGGWVNNETLKELIHNVIINTWINCRNNFTYDTKNEFDRDISKLINWHELSRQLSGKGQNIRPNKIPKRYQRKINRLLKILEVWLRWAKSHSEATRRDASEPALINTV